MKTKLSVIMIIAGLILFHGGLVFGNPGMLPNHPGYPMGDAKSPVTGQSVANDPGQSPPTLEDSLQQGASFHDAHAMNPSQEIRSSIVPPDLGGKKEVDAASKSKP
ncbi:MAG: hypothetical protein AB7P17_03415 [Nitrospirales bacterium]